MTRVVLGSLALLLLASFTLAQTVPVVTGDARVDKLLSQMSPEEKLTLIHGTKKTPRPTRDRPAISLASCVWAFPASALQTDLREH